MLVVPALVLAHSRSAAARLSTLAEPAAAIPLSRSVDAVATRSADRFAFAAPDPAPATTLAAPPTTVAVVTISTTPVTRVVRTVTTRPKATTTTTARRPVAPRPPPAPPTTVVGRSQSGPASWYYGPVGSCAHPTLPMGTVITVTDLATGASATCKVGGRGPYGGTFIVDLDQATFAKLAPLSAGVIEVRITW